MAPDAAVSEVFRRMLRIWEDTLKRWITKCKGVDKERRTLENTGGLVADRTAPVSRWWDNPLLSDASPPPKSGGVTEELETRLGDLRARSRRCADTIRMLEETISDLREAMKTGQWRNRNQLAAGLRKAPSFVGELVGKVSRGEFVDVVEVRGDWWRVRTKSGVEGWIHRREYGPHLPVELSSEKSSLMPGREDPDELEIGGRG
jgi:hypothetical protein